ncbi:hypothetical protein A9308_00540 [Moraxella atlantae]|uniref:Uncharacterized protein n=1 Tax=Faucicola atlantae TaxID=34059 RepID=A0A1B8Q951_9GAMM|nr:MULTISPECIES: hypothetical protein [Bacteria]MDZ5288560.1 hypothetical protein [Helicobacter pylori]OBX73731.1 hypothetical protein A9308_00540 [Moraxella atlantae]
MANYLYTNDPGTARRRAKTIVINNPSSGTPSIEFVMEDRIIMADGSEQFINSGVFVVSIDKSVMVKKYPRIDIKTGESVGKERSGAEIFDMIMKAITDVFITEGRERD